MRDSIASINELKTHPWILLGWGVRREAKWKNLERMKEQWTNQIEKAAIPTFGKKHKNRMITHPCPLIPTKRPIIVDELISLYRQEVNGQLITINEKI
jgi:hypothetical protein